MAWNAAEIVEAAHGALMEREGELGREQAVYGLDALDEVELHPILARGLEQGGWGVLREVPYPTETSRRVLPRERRRCDLVLTPGAGESLLDPLVERRRRLAAQGTLFESLATQPGPGIDPADAYWLEVKAVGQVAFVRGVPGPNAAYSSLLTSSLSKDLRKLGDQVRLGRDEGDNASLARCGLLLVLFTLDEATARHDLRTAMHRCADDGALARAPEVRVGPIRDRVGNACCACALVEV